MEAARANLWEEQALFNAELQRRYTLPAAQQDQMRAVVSETFEAAVATLQSEHTELIRRENKNFQVLNSR